MNFSPSPSSVESTQPLYGFEALFFNKRYVQLIITTDQLQSTMKKLYEINTNLSKRFHKTPWSSNNHFPFLNEKHSGLHSPNVWSQTQFQELALSHKSSQSSTYLQKYVYCSPTKSQKIFDTPNFHKTTISLPPNMELRLLN